MSEGSTVIRIVIVVDTMGAGGKERRLLELLKGLERREEVLVRLYHFIRHHSVPGGA